VNDKRWQEEQFERQRPRLRAVAYRIERQRPRLRAVAYRMLGSVTEAEDAVQEAWLRLHGTSEGAIENLAAWLTTVVGRVCIDILRARQTRRKEFPGAWLPEPIVSIDELLDPEQEALLANSVGLALLVVLETLTPPERPVVVSAVPPQGPISPDSERLSLPS
jgi:RNA polymerase sigma factor (sigma-70 family)